MTQKSISWWLDWAALPDQYLWARLTVMAEGTAEVLDCDGKKHEFADLTAARYWLLEDEYACLEQLVSDGAVSADLTLPQWA